MAKLYGTADPTLVKMAYAESMANVPLDLSSVYKQREQNIKDFATGVSSIMDSIYKDYNDSIDNATTKGQDVDDILTMEGGIFNDAWILENDNAVKGLKDRLKQLDPRKGGDEERAAIGRELQKYKNTMASSQEIFSNLLANSANGSLLGDLKDNGELELWNTILGDIKNNTNNSNAKYENGEMTFSLGDKKMTMSDLNKALTANDPAYSANFQKNHINTLASLATKRQGNITPNDIAIWKNNATKGIISWDQVRILENEKFGKSPYTFRDVLHGQAKNPITGEVDTGALRILYDALDNIGGVDMNNDGTINKTDADMYRSSENGAKLIEELKKDKGKYTELMVGYFGETVIKDHWEQGAALRKAQTTGGGRGGARGGGRGLEYGRDFGGVWKKDQLVREKAIAANTQQPFYDFTNTYWEPIGNDMFEDKDGNKKSKWDIAVGSDLPMDLLSPKPSGFGETGGIYKMPATRKSDIKKIFDSGKSEKYAVTQLNNMFGGGFTQEDMWDKYTIGYNEKTFNLKNDKDRIALITEIEGNYDPLNPNN